MFSGVLVVWCRIDVARIFQDAFIRAGAPRTGPQGAHAAEIVRWLLILGPSWLQGAPPGHWVLIGCPVLTL